MDVAGLRFAAPASTRTLQRVQTPTPPQELPRGVNVTTFDSLFTGILHPRTKLSSRFSVYYSMRTQRPECNMINGKYDETRMAEEIVSILPAGVAREFSAERDAIRYAVRAD